MRNLLTHRSNYNGVDCGVVSERDCTIGSSVGGLVLSELGRNGRPAMENSDDILCKTADGLLSTRGERLFGYYELVCLLPDARTLVGISYPEFPSRILVESNGLATVSGAVIFEPNSPITVSVDTPTQFRLSVTSLKLYFVAVQPPAAYNRAYETAVSISNAKTLQLKYAQPQLELLAASGEKLGLFCGRFCFLNSHLSIRPYIVGHSNTYITFKPQDTAQIIISFKLSASQPVVLVGKLNDQSEICRGEFEVGESVCQFSFFLSTQNNFSVTPICATTLSLVVSDFFISIN